MCIRDRDGIVPAKSVTSQLYRETAVGKALMEALQEMIRLGKFGPDLSTLVMQQFDQSFVVAQQKVTQEATIKGHIHTYRFIDGVWTFMLEDALFKSGNDSVPVDYLEIIATDSKSYS
eukprot:TRINITY_DN14951_c0_g1_i6.p1 TRINITY_DN14951_c0_g1~~TRINITY_DN14951_c0_g1_i6.p1  ORF type:complete len:118 (-),score=43.47 TRINITY_DN14951_c0_g1_i6:154-507(-)